MFLLRQYLLPCRRGQCYLSSLSSLWARLRPYSLLFQQVRLTLWSQSDL